MATSKVHKSRSRKTKLRNDIRKRWFWSKCNAKSYERINNWLANNTIKVVPSDEDVIEDAIDAQV